MNMNTDTQDLTREVATGLDRINQVIHSFKESFRYNAESIPDAIRGLDKRLNTIANHLDDLRWYEPEVDAILEDPNIVGLDAQVLAIHSRQILTIVEIARLFNRDIIDIQAILSKAK